MDSRFVCLTGLFSAALSFSPAMLFADGTTAQNERWDGYIEMDGRRIPMGLDVSSLEDGSISGKMSLQNGEQGTSQVLELENFAISGTKVLFNLKDQKGNPTFRGNISPDGTVVSGTYSVDGAEHLFEVRYVWPEQLAAETSTQAPSPAEPAPTPSAPTPAAPVAAQPQDQTERWDGTIQLPGQSLGVQLAFKNNPDGTISGEVSLPSQNAANVQVTDFTINGFDLAFSIPNIAGNPTFKGTISEDGQHVHGTFTQSGQDFPFALTYIENPTPQTKPQAPAQFANATTHSTAAAAPVTASSSTTSDSLSSSAAVGQPEHWSGFVTVAGQHLSIACNFVAQSDDSIAGTITIPQQGAVNVPISDIKIVDHEISFVIVSVPGAPMFRGTISEDGERINGIYSQSGQGSPFELKYTKHPIPQNFAHGSEPAAAPMGIEIPVGQSLSATTSSSAVSSGVASVALHTSSNPASEPERWNGSIELPGQTLAFDLDFLALSSGEITGDITIPAQGAKDLPLEKISITNTSVKATIKGIPGNPTFDGQIVGDGREVKGTFSQGDGKFPFTWTYVDNPSASISGDLSGFIQWAEQARKDWRAPGLAIAIVKDGRVILNQGFGVKDLDSNSPVTPKTQFAIGSCTKAFTTFALGTLVDQGKIAWDTPVRTYLPEFKLKDPFASDHMTPRDLVTHRSGLPRHDAMWYNSTLPRAEMISRLAYLEPSKDFREAWQYNNLMYVTAGYLIERVAGGSWEDAISSRIFMPIGMTNSNTSVAAMQQAPDFAYPYEWRDEKIRKMPFRDISQVGPAGSINSSIEDMTKWMLVHLAGGKSNGQQVIAPTTLAELMRPQMVMSGESTEPEIINIGYGLGWMISAYRGRLMVEHGGNIDGFSALVTLLPKDGIGIVALTNINSSPLPQLATYHALDTLLNEKKKDWNATALSQRTVGEAMNKEGKEKKQGARKPGTSPSHALSEYAGNYEHPGYGAAKVWLEGDKLWFAYNNISAPLEHWHFEVFTCGANEKDPILEDTQLLFRTNLSGEVDSIEIVLDPSVKPIIFQKKASEKMRDAAYLAKFIGDYELGPQVISVSIKGTTLFVTVPGQPSYELIPTKDDGFKLKELNGFSIDFKSTDGAVTEAVLIQPNGLFTAKRK